MHILYAKKSARQNVSEFSLSLCLSDIEVQSQLSEHINFDSSARPGWVTSNKVSGSLLPQFPATVRVSCICMQDQSHFAAQHNVAKDNAENSDLCVGCFFNVVVMTVLNQFLPLTLSQLTTGCLLKMVNKPARNLPVPSQDLTRHQ